MSSKPHHLATLALALITAGSLIRPVAAATPSDEAMRHTAAIFTFHNDGRLVPSKVFSGVVINSKFILTSSWALGQGHASPFAPPRSNSKRKPSMIYAVVQSSDGQRAVVQCEPAAIPNERSPVILLKVNDVDAETLATVTPKPFKTTKLAQSSAVTAVGAFPAFGVGPGEMDSSLVPAPVAVTANFGEMTSVIDDHVPAATLTHTLPDSFVGGGVWDSNDQLIGVIARHKDRWFVLDPAGAAGMLKNAKPINPDKANPARPKPGPNKPAKNPDRTRPAPTIEPTKPDKPKPSPQPSGVLQPDTIAKARVSEAMLSMMKDLDLQLQIPPGLIDHVEQEQADMVMAYIAGGRTDEAMETLNDIEPLVSGKLAEQLNYRRALTLVLTGQYAEAKARATTAAQANDPKVAARGTLLTKILTSHPDGKVDGAALSDPAVLSGAARRQLVETRRQLIGDFRALSGDPDPAQLKDLQRRVDEASLAWPGYLKDLSKAINGLVKSTSGTE